MSDSGLAGVAAILHETKDLQKTTSDLMNCLLGPAVTEAGLALKDQIRAFRIQRTITLTERVRRRLKQAKINPREMPKSFILPLLADSWDAADEDIHTAFAELLAAAVSDQLFEHPTFRLCLHQMCADEARLLSEWALGRESRGYICYYDVKNMITGPKLFDVAGLGLKSPDRAPFYLDNSIRLGLVDFNWSPSESAWPDAITSAFAYQEFVKKVPFEIRKYDFGDGPIFLSRFGAALGRIAVKASEPL